MPTIPAPVPSHPASAAKVTVCSPGPRSAVISRTAAVCLVLVGLLMSGISLLAADISGRITLQGAPPPERPVDLTDFQDVTRAYPGLVGKLATRHYVVSPDGGLANVFIYVKEGLAGRTFPVATNLPLLDQTNAGFYPYLLGVQTRQTFLIRNSEPYMDAPQCETKTNKAFNFAQPMTGMISRHSFEKPEVLIRVKCGIHPWEFAFIGVVPHPFFAVSGVDGRYALPAGLPAGHYVLEAVHPKAGRLTREVNVTEQGKQVVDFGFEVPAPKK